MRKFSQELIWRAREFSRAAKQELGDELGDERVCAMFDAFDHSLRRQMFMDLLTGHLSGSMRVRAVWLDQKQKIPAVKAIRSVTGLGLKEAKVVIDAADQGIGVIDGNWDTEYYNKLRHALRDTGYDLL